MATKDQNKKDQNDQPEQPTTATLPTGISMAEFNDNSVGEMFGGSFPLIALEENQVSPLLEYTKDTKVPIEVDGKSEIKTIPVASVVGNPDAPMVSMPISAIFVKNWKEADIKIGDQFHVGRYPDAIKKRGVGKGNKMKVYGLKVMKRK
jgi:hypothetical protein